MKTWHRNLKGFGNFSMIVKSDPQFSDTTLNTKFPVGISIVLWFTWHYGINPRGYFHASLLSGLDSISKPIWQRSITEMVALRRSY